MRLLQCVAFCRRRRKKSHFVNIHDTRPWNASLFPFVMSVRKRARLPCWHGKDVPLKGRAEGGKVCAAKCLHNCAILLYVYLAWCCSKATEDHSTSLLKDPYGSMAHTLKAFPTGRPSVPPHRAAICTGQLDDTQWRTSSLRISVQKGVGDAGIRKLMSTTPKLPEIDGRLGARPHHE